MDIVSDLTSECFTAIGRLRALEEPVASPEAVHGQLRAFVDTFKQRARKAGLPEKDAQDIAYALVALADEVALRAPEPLRGYWMNQPLQLHYFGENVAGEGFFTRLDSLLADGRRLAVLRVYQLCLLFGFQGKYGFPGGEVELMRIAETVRTQVERNQEVPSALSPAGEAPDEPLLRSAGRNLLLWASLGILALALAVFVGLRVSFDRQVGDLSSRVDEIAP
ncbi:MAG TPA: DotU family type IV/VI secretion system protein [Polyangia bacterium]|jgi:type IV / VI secretion system protein, DotU family|nr:DotU family type IV/VI secretion system protein [Polyangia bacterium]